MLRGADLGKLLDEGYGDAGFNDPVPDLDDDSKAARAPKAAARAPPTAAPRPSAAPASSAAAAAKEAAGGAGARTAPKPHERPVLGATPPPPEGADLEQYEVTQALDTIARQKGFESAADFNASLQEAQGTGKKAEEEMEEQQLAPGIKKSPAYMPPGAYPGDRTKIGKEADYAPLDPRPAMDPGVEGMRKTFVKQSDTYGSRPSEGQTITYRLDGADATHRAELGGETLPWALEAAVEAMKVGDIVDVSARGEHAFADNEALRPGAERAWRLELLAVEGQSMDKFKLDTLERIDRANALRLRGNAMFKLGRVLRALDYYERGSKLMDVLEAEELGLPGKKDSKAVERNRRIWQCQQPLLLNWALALMKRGCWQEAERKCTEVLMDIEKECVKALFRRGQCNIQLGNHEQARTDLRRAAELDTTIAKDVEREMRKVEEMQRNVDQQDSGFAQKVVTEFLQEADARSARPPPARPAEEEEAPVGPTDHLVRTLQAQEAAAQQQGASEDDYRRQRQAIYNQFLQAGMMSAGPVEE